MAKLNEYNFAVLKRLDPYAKGLLETAAHVALFTFKATNEEWEKTDIEGTLFVYSRTSEPFFNILIKNGLNMKYLIESDIRSLNITIDNPFISYKNSQGSVHAIWFYDNKECVKVARVLIHIIKGDLKVNPEKEVGQSAEVSGNNVDSFPMLTQSVKDFFTKVRKDSILVNNINANQPPKHLQFLMSDSTYRVANIENQERTTAPQCAFGSLENGNHMPGPSSHNTANFKANQGCSKGKNNPPRFVHSRQFSNSQIGQSSLQGVGLADGSTEFNLIQTENSALATSAELNRADEEKKEDSGKPCADSKCCSSCCRASYSRK